MASRGRHTASPETRRGYSSPGMKSSRPAVRGRPALSYTVESLTSSKRAGGSSGLIMNAAISSEPCASESRGRTAATVTARASPTA